MLRQHDIGMRGGNGGVEDRAQERASVGHEVTRGSDKDMQRPYPSDRRKRKPP
jgi:hypothetical protein